MTFTPPLVVQKGNRQIPLTGAFAWDIDVETADGSGIDVRSGWTGQIVISNIPGTIRWNQIISGSQNSLDWKFYSPNGIHLVIQDCFTTFAFGSSDVAPSNGTYSVYLSNDGFATKSLVETGTYSTVNFDLPV